MERLKTRFLLLVMFFIPFASAQIGGGGAGGGAYSIFEVVFNVDVSSPGEIITQVLIPMIAFYSIARFATELPFKLAGGNFKERTGISMDSKTTKRSAKALAFAIALGLTNMLGEASLPLMILLGVVALAGFALKLTGQGVFAMLGFANQASDSVSSGTQSIGSAIGKIGSGIKDLKSKEDQTEKEESNGGDPHQIAGEIKVEEQELEQIISSLESVESKMEQKLQEIKEAEDYILQEEQQEESEIEEAQQIEKQALNDLQGFLQDLQQRAQGNPRNSPQRMEEDRQIANDLEQQLNEFQELEDVYRKEYDVHQRLVKYIQELQALKEEAQEIDTEGNQLKALIKELEDEEVTAEKIAKQYNDEQDWETIKQEEQEMQNIIQELKNALQEKQRIEQRIQDEIEKLKKERRYDQQEVQEIKQILQELQQEESMLNEIESIYANTPMDSRINQEIIPQFEESLHKIENDTQNLLNALNQMEN